MSRAEQTHGQRDGGHHRGGRSAAPVLEAASVRDERGDRFVELSAFLTGYGRVELTGTGLAGLYLQTLDAVLPAGVLDELLDAYRRLPAGAIGAAGAGRDVAGGTLILDDPKLGPVARNIILLWYCGTWTALSEAWRAAYGSSPLDTSRVVSAEAYQGALQWAAAGAHPAGARQQGFGAWSAAPEEARG
jgi:hypothetical protein